MTDYHDEARIAELSAVRELVALLRLTLEHMPDQERIGVRNRLMEGYCQICGSALLPCYCERDE